MHSQPIAVTPREALDWIQNDQGPLCVDVREASEVAFCRLPHSIHIPLGSLDKSYQTLPRDRPLLLICHHGGRSGRACDFLRSHGYKATNLTGGIDRWSTDCDSSIPRY